MSAPRSRATKQARKPKAIDFDAIKSKKAVTLGAIPPVKIGGKTFDLRPSLPLSVTDHFAEKSHEDKEGNLTVLLGDMQFILGELFGEQQWAEIRRLIDISDVPDLFTTVFDLYGESVGESSDSGES